MHNAPYVLVVLQIKGFLAANLQTIHEKQNSDGKEGGNLYISFELAARKGARRHWHTGIGGGMYKAEEGCSQ